MWRKRGKGEGLPTEGDRGTFHLSPFCRGEKVRRNRVDLGVRGQEQGGQWPGRK